MILQYILYILFFTLNVELLSTFGYWGDNLFSNINRNLGGLPVHFLRNDGLFFKKEHFYLLLTSSIHISTKPIHLVERITLP